MKKTTIDQQLFSDGIVELSQSDGSNSFISLNESAILNNTDKSSLQNADNVSDGLLLSLNNKGKVDIEYISQVCSCSVSDVLSNLKGYIFLNPAKYSGNLTEGWETKEEYLSGNLNEKLSKAKEANKTHPGLFENNIDAIKKEINRIPKLSADEIYVTLGTPWLEPYIIELFIKEVLKSYVKVKHDHNTGSWSIVGGNRYSPIVQVQYGTSKLNAFDIITRTLNQTPLIVYKNNINSKKAERDDNETLFAITKQSLLMDTFEKWLKATPSRRKYIENLYNSTYGCTVTRHFDGSFLTMPEVNPDIDLFGYQKDAIARMILTPNTLLAHDVGSGKSYEMIGAAHEKRRMGLAKKILFVVPNNIVGQWKQMYLKLYPKSNLLVVEPKKFGPKNRNEVLNDIIYNDYDSIIMAYSTFNLIDLSPDVLKTSIKEEVEKVKASFNDKDSLTTQVKRSFTNYCKGAYEKDIENLGEREPGKIYFDDLGIDQLFLDESHNYKNVPIKSNIHALGINKSGSKQCEMMLQKVHYIQRTHNGGGVVFATGTPITNSVSDVYNIQRYLQEGELAVLKLQSFNAWIANFAELTQNFEIDVDTSSFRMASRFSKFHNLPELSAMLSNIADFHKVDATKDLPEFNGYKDVIVETNDEFKEFLKTISERADAIRAKQPFEFKSADGKKQIKDNMLLVTQDGRDAALDIRLVNKKSKFNKNCKCVKCADAVAKIYFDNYDEKLTQLIFCDTSTPSNSHFNVYYEVKRLLILRGVNPNEIAFVHDANTETQRKALFKKVNDGEIRVLIGSTFKLGTGVNVQKKLIAVHHLDIPWRPSDMIQRQGRILRPGNTNKEVFIYRYVTKSSFDSYSYQLLETKQNFISKLLNNSVNERSSGDIDDTVLSYAEVKSLAIGNPLIKERVEVNNQLNKTISLRAQQSERIAKLKAAIQFVDDNKDKWLKEIQQADADEDYIDEFVEIESFSDADAMLDSADKKANVLQRNNLKETIYSAVLKNGMSPTETYIDSYQGFNIYAPAFTNAHENKFVYLTREGKYKVYIGNSNVGVLVRLNNFLKNFHQYLDELRNKFKEQMNLVKVSNKEICDAVDYSSEIKELRERLAIIDCKLGLEKEN